MTIIHKIVKSSNIHSIGYDEPNKELHIKFKGGPNGGATWVYEGVEPQAHSDLMMAPSHGVHFIENVRGVYKERKL